MRQYNKRPYFVLSRSKPRGRAVPAPEHAPPPPGHGASAPGSNDSRETTESVESCDSCEAAAAWQAARPNGIGLGALAPIHKIPIKLFDTVAMCISLLILYDFCASPRSRSGDGPRMPSVDTPPASFRGKDGLRRAGFPGPVDFPTVTREEGALTGIGHEHSHLIP